MVALDRRSVRGLPHGHRGVAGQQIHHHAFVGRIEMLHQYERHAVSGRQCAYKLSAGVEASRRGAYSDNREICGCDRRPTRRNGARAGSRSGRFWLVRTIVWHLPMALDCALPEPALRTYMVTNSLI